jgi:hypothetical protein
MSRRRGTLGAIVAWGMVACATGACATPAPPPPVVAPPPPPPPAVPEAPSLTDVKLGPITLTVSDARTAQVFHIVNALAKATASSRGAYGEWADRALPLDDAERATLAAHAKLHARRGRGLDQAFYVTMTIDEAAKRAVAKKLLLPAEAEAERALLDHFAPRLDPLLEAQTATLQSFESDASKALKRAAPLASQLGRFCETSEVIEVQAFLVADPSSSRGGSAWEGGRFAVEVMPGYDNVPTFLHELFHAVLARRRGSFAIGAAKCDEPIDPETMQEGVAYAFAPGLVHPAGRDVLLEMVNEDSARPLSMPFVRHERLGLALRTELGSALEGGHDTLGAFLPKECEAWGKIARP